jgi:hypothetical protein
MRKTGFILALISFFAFAPAAMAIPTLQLDIPEGEYDPVTEGAVIDKSEPFELWALLTTADPSLADGTFYLSIALIPSEDTTDNYGSFVLDGMTYDVSDDMIYGNPPALEASADLAPHGVFPTYYLETPFTFANADTIQPYDVDPDGDQTAGPQFEMYYVPFQIDASGIVGGYNLHFDLYYITFSDNSDEPDGLIFAPFSHDAETVPEPQSLVVLGIGMVCLVAFRRRIKFNY